MIFRRCGGGGHVAAAAAAALALFLSATACAGASLKVMSLNLAVGGEAMKRPLEDSAAVVRASGADVVGLQETHGGRDVNGVAPENGQKLAEMLGWRYLAQPNKCGVLTRLEIVRPTRDKHGAVLRTTNGTQVIVFNVHLPAAPYQPYLLSGIAYARDVTFLKTEDEAVRSARLARGKQLDALAADVRAELDEAADSIMFVTGDFNEPSHLDWTDAAARAGACPIKVAWPASRAMAEFGFVDAYRHVHRDPLANPGHTWTPTTEPTDKSDRHDRIDFVYVRGVARDAIEGATVVGEKPSAAHVVVTPWPSDHRAVLASVRLDGKR